MSSRSSLHIILTLATLIVIGDSRQSFAKKDKSGDGANQIQSNNDNNGGGRRNRNRNRNNDNQVNSGIQIEGTDVQQALQGLQGNLNNDPQSGNSASQGGQLQGGNQFRNSQQLQNWQLNNQGSFKKKHKHNDWHGWAIQFGGPAPFSAQWYHNHPQAWHHVHFDDDDAWKFATVAGVLGWLGWHDHHHHHAVIYEPVPVDTYYVEGQPLVIDPNAQGQWMTLGIYSLMTGPGDTGTRILELAVDKFGRVRGNYYDAIINASHTVTGRIDEPTQFVQWSLDSNKQLTFFAPLSQLTQPQGVINVRFPGGQQEQWPLTRMENAGN